MLANAPRLKHGAIVTAEKPYSLPKWRQTRAESG